MSSSPAPSSALYILSNSFQPKPIYSSHTYSHHEVLLCSGPCSPRPRLVARASSYVFGIDSSASSSPVVGTPSTSLVAASSSTSSF